VTSDTKRPKVATLKTPSKSVAAKAKPSATRNVAASTPPTTKTAPLDVLSLKKSQLVRDSFTIPKQEYAAIELLKLRAAKLGHPIKKSELLRAGLKALNAMTDIQLKAALSVVPAIKTGRPKHVK